MKTQAEAYALAAWPVQIIRDHYINAVPILGLGGSRRDHFRVGKLGFGVSLRPSPLRPLGCQKRLRLAVAIAAVPYAGRDIIVR